MSSSIKAALKLHPLKRDLSILSITLPLLFSCKTSDVAKLKTKDLVEKDEVIHISIDDVSVSRQEVATIASSKQDLTDIILQDPIALRFLKFYKATRRHIDLFILEQISKKAVDYSHYKTAQGYAVPIRALVKGYEIKVEIEGKPAFVASLFTGWKGINIEVVREENSEFTLDGRPAKNGKVLYEINADYLRLRLNYGYLRDLMSGQIYRTSYGKKIQHYCEQVLEPFLKSEHFEEYIHGKRYDRDVDVRLRSDVTLPTIPKRVFPKVYVNRTKTQILAEAEVIQKVKNLIFSDPVKNEIIEARNRMRNSSRELLARHYKFLDWVNQSQTYKDKIGWYRYYIDENWTPLLNTWQQKMFDGHPFDEPKKKEKKKLSKPILKQKQ